MKLGLSDKDSLFLKKWSRTRAKGKKKYVLLNGIMFGVLLFLVWLVVTLIEINVSEFQKSLYNEYPSYLIRKCVIWITCYMIFGLILAAGTWKRNEEKFEYLS